MGGTARPFINICTASLFSLAMLKWKYVHVKEDRGTNVPENAAKYRIKV